MYLFENWYIDIVKNGIHKGNKTISVTVGLVAKNTSFFILNKTPCIFLYFRIFDKITYIKNIKL
jgi:hypothetical protein